MKKEINRSFTTEQMRLNKALAMLGICSRRDADRLIMSGEIFVNGEVITKVGTKVSMKDTIQVFGKIYTINNKKFPAIWLYYKPRGLITSHNDERGRRTVFDDVCSKINERVISVGRLDLNSEGLLLLTNDAAFARQAESPQAGWKRHYKVRVFGTLTEEIVNKVAKGITIDGINYAPIQITSLHDEKFPKNEKVFGKANTPHGNTRMNHWIECVLLEGKNREIRKILNHFGLAVNRLIRTRYGIYELGSLKPGEVKLATVKNNNFTA